MYSYKKQVKTTFEVAVERTKEGLKKEGFGIMTEIDVEAILKKKLNVEFNKGRRR